MKAATRHCVCITLAVGALALTLAHAPTSRAEELKITSSPPGAAVEIDGVAVGKTPYKVKYPGGYFHKPHTAFGARLEHAMVARFTMAGYVTQEISLTDGPLVWVAVNGKREGNYFVLKSDHFNVDLEPRTRLADGAFDAAHAAGPLPVHAPERVTQAASTGPAESSAGSVSIRCDPGSAEIYVDGKFVGQAPATLRLASGPHRVEVRAAGRRTWSRDLEVMKDSQISLHPVLESSP